MVPAAPLVWLFGPPPRIPTPPCYTGRRCGNCPLWLQLSPSRAFNFTSGYGDGQSPTRRPRAQQRTTAAHPGPGCFGDFTAATCSCTPSPSHSPAMLLFPFCTVYRHHRESRDGPSPPVFHHTDDDSWVTVTASKLSPQRYRGSISKLASRGRRDVLLVLPDPPGVEDLRRRSLVPESSASKIFGDSG